MRAEAADKDMSNRPWFGRLKAVGEAGGFFERLGQTHTAVFIDETRTLLVTFTQSQALDDAPDGLPMGHELAGDAGWSLLSIVTDRENWFRDPAVYGFFDRLVDDGFFEQFDRVVFYGAGMCGYAAAAFSVAAPGATVIALSPQATLDPRVTEWDPRFKRHRRLSFTDRYGYAPDMLDAAERAYVLYDPHVMYDAMHAALFTRPNVTKLRCRWLDGALEADLTGMGILAELIDAACEGQLTPQAFHRLFRARRSYKPYLRRMLATLEAADRPWLIALMCKNITERMHAPRFKKRLKQSAKALARAGKNLPGATAGDAPDDD